MGTAYGPSIVTSGLLMYLDAANIRSYSGSGTSFNGLFSSIGGTLINGTGYTSDGGGSFVFDGTNDYLQFSNLF